MNKAELRKAYKLKRNALSQAELTQLDAQILQQLQGYDWSGITYLHCYLSIEKFKEYNTMPFIHWIWEHHPHIVILISKSDFQTNELTHYPFSAETILSLNAWGIPEPEAGIEVLPRTIDAVLTPLLVLDKAGNRVGYGKGFYDRFFASCRPEVKKLGISYFEPVEQIEDVQPWDVPIEVVFTPENTYFLK